MAFEFKLPDIGEGVVEGEIVRWFVKEGDQVDEDQPLVEVMTDKATVEIPSPRKGKVLERIGEEGQIVKVGATLVVLEQEGAATSPSQRPAGIGIPKDAPRKGSRAAHRSSASDRKVLAVPAIRRMAREMQIDLGQVRGSGPGGRVTESDLRSFRSKTETTHSEAGGEIETIPYRGIRRKIGEHLALSKRTAAHYTYVEEADLTDLVRLRAELQEPKKHQGLRLTYLPFFLKAVAIGLREYPLLNSTLDERREVIQIKKHYNVGVAIDTPQGLVVPVVRAVDQKDLWELAREVAELAEAARAGKSRLEDLRDGTFTVTSLGPEGGILATPVINHPEVAILGIHKISPRPVVRDREIVIREMANLSLSLDHRVVDGALGAKFIHHIIPLLENPKLLL